MFLGKVSSLGVEKHESAQANEEEPVQPGRARLSPSGQGRRCWAGESFACGQKGHLVDTWPSQGKRCSPLIPLGILMGAT